MKKIISLSQNILIVSFCILFHIQAYAFREAREREARPREFQSREFQHNDANRHPAADHDDYHPAARHDAATHPYDHPNSLSAAHKENVAQFSKQHLTMNPHQGIPNKAVKQNQANNNSNNSNNGNTTNNYTYNGNSGWNGGNYGYGGGWSGWNGGLAAGTLFGATLGTALIASTYYPPASYAYYPVAAPITFYPTTVPTYTSSTNAAPSTSAPAVPSNSSTIDDTTTLPSDEAWTTAKDGDVPKNAVINNTQNGKSTYYCRTTFNNQLSYGVLVAQDGCYVETSSVTMRFTTYDVLTKK